MQNFLIILYSLFVVVTTNLVRHNIAAADDAGIVQATALQSIKCRRFLSVPEQCVSYCHSAMFPLVVLPADVLTSLAASSISRSLMIASCAISAI